MVSADLLREARLRAGLTQRELAARAGKPQSTIARWERGRVEPSLEALREVIRAAGLDLTYGLAAYDDSYVPQIEAQLRLAPKERVDRMVELAAAQAAIRAARG